MPVHTHTINYSYYSLTCRALYVLVSWDKKTADLKVRANEMEISLQDGTTVGSGAFGTVHQAWWRGHEAAVKILHNMNNDDSLVAFAKELELGMKLQDCASFARVLGACLERPYVCIISEFLPGKSMPYYELF